jgi:uncharacterized phage infection (PIP) family protein YhgE
MNAQSYTVEQQAQFVLFKKNIYQNITLGQQLLITFSENLSELLEQHPADVDHIMDELKTAVDQITSLVKTAKAQLSKDVSALDDLERINTQSFAALSAIETLVNKHTQTTRPSLN